jgi:hypothetical protein
LAVKFIEIVGVAICIGAIALTNTIIIQTDIGIVENGNTTNKRSQGTPLTESHSAQRKVRVSADAFGWVLL